MTTHDIAKVERTEMYLKSVLVIALNGHRVTTSRVADAMGVSAPSASEMLKRLEHLGYLDSGPEGVQLTDAGVRTATQVVRRLRLAERLLTDILKMDLERVYDEACKMEHVISPEVESRLDDVLKRPETCPHGHAIPRPDGVLPPEDVQTLAALPARIPARVTALPEERTDLLKAVLATGLYLGAEVTVEATATPRGPVIVRLHDRHRTIPREAAEQVRISLTNAGEG
jgi:DtxR family transcriptional regulator, Mn-dependent transcriptional regulator